MRYFIGLISMIAFVVFFPLEAEASHLELSETTESVEEKNEASSNVPGSIYMDQWLWCGHGDGVWFSHITNGREYVGYLEYTGTNPFTDKCRYAGNLRLKDGPYVPLKVESLS